jgi:aspartate/methionine/tyrosine aminotransferase
VAVTPGSYFFNEPVKNFVRMNFSKSDETLHVVGQRLLRLPEKI